MMFIGIMGGCGGSTAGGMKVIRWVILVKQGRREIDRLLHPRLVAPLKIGGRVLPESAADAVWGFLGLYVATFCLAMLALMAGGMDQVSAFSSVATCLSNLGPALGAVSTNFALVEPFSKWVLSLVMIMGRLEIFTVLVLLSPAFWKR